MPTIVEGLHVDVLDNGVFRADVDSLVKTIVFTKTVNAFRDEQQRAFARANAAIEGRAWPVCRCPRCRTDNE